MDYSISIRDPQGQSEAKSSGMRSYEKSARKSFRITSFQNKGLKVPSNHTLTQKGVGGGAIPMFASKRAPYSELPTSHWSPAAGRRSRSSSLLATRHSLALRHEGSLATASLPRRIRAEQGSTHHSRLLNQQPARDGFASLHRSQERLRELLSLKIGKRETGRGFRSLHLPSRTFQE